MKTNYVQDLEVNSRVTTFFLVQSKEIRFKKNSGEPYLSLMLSDRTGRIEAKMWDGVEEVAETFDRDDFVKVKANVQLYRDQNQLVIQKLRRAEESEVDLSDYVPHTKRDLDEMIAELRGVVNGFTNPHLQALLRAFLDDESLVSRLRVAPAAKSMHHATVGGLLEHVCSLMNLARLVASNYDYLDVDLLQTGVFLHDLGKLDELSYGRSFNYTDEGQLLGHITICIRLIDRKCAELPDFPPRLKTLVEHMVLSHHGKYEFGSPKLPSFPEALALSYIDDLDSKLESMRAALDAEVGSDGMWTRYNPALERSLLNSTRYLAEPAEAPEAEAAEPVGEATPPAPPLPVQRTLPTGPSPAADGGFGSKLKAALDSKLSS